MHEVDYVVTQYLAEYVMTKGFDGIKYPSAMGGGANLVLFDPGKVGVGKITQYRVAKMLVKYEWHPATDI